MAYESSVIVGSGVNPLKYGPGMVANATDQERCAKLLAEMRRKTNRKAAFECVLSIAVPSGAALTYEARCEGLIAEKAVGFNGFGYDPIFYYPPLRKTFAELTRQEKGRVSHRGRAMQTLKSEFDKVLIWIDQNMPVFEKLTYKGEEND